MNLHVLSVFVLVASVTVVISSPVKGGESATLSCPAGEIYEKCSQIHCYKNCGHLKNHPACPSVSADCFNPACECAYGTLRNNDGVCIPEKDCPEWTHQL